MIDFRAIPSLILKNNNLVKGDRFENHSYVGDPRNVIKIFNDKDVDEIVLVDPFISRISPESVLFLGKVLSHCFLPVTYGGGIKTISDVESLNRIGVEKYLFKYTDNFDMALVKKVSEIKGMQSIVLHVPYFTIYDKVSLKKRKFFSKSIGMSELKTVSQYVGEVVFTDIDSEGLRSGVTKASLISEMVGLMSCPVLYQGGVRNSPDLRSLEALGFSGALVGASFIYAGRKNSVNIGYFR